MSSVLDQLVNKPYEHGFRSDIESDVAPKGLSEDTIRMISAKKNEPEWLLEFRLKAYRHWLTMEEPTWPNVHYPKIDFQDIIYFSAPKQKKKLSMDEFDRLRGHPVGRVQHDLRGMDGGRARAGLEERARARLGRCHGHCQPSDAKRRHSLLRDPADRHRAGR
jgi:Fe-S cluster assembly scaffold protein SufB